MKKILFIAVQDFKLMLKDKSVLIWLFIMPLVFFAFIGSTTGGLGSSQGQPQTLALWYEGDAEDALYLQLTQRLVAENFSLRTFNEQQTLYKDKWQFDDYDRQLWLPNQLSHSLQNKTPIKIEYRVANKNMNANFQVFKLYKAIYQTLGDVLVLDKLNPNQSKLDFTEVNNLPQHIMLDVGSAGEARTIPNGYKQAVPGILVMFIMMSAVTSGAISLLLERQSGILERLAATPIARSQIILGKCLGKWFLTACQLIYGMLAGSLLFSIDWGPHSFMVFVLLLSWAGACAGLAVLMGSWGKTESQVSGIAVISTLLLAALGGCWWPIEVAPAWMQQLALFLPTGWVMDALHRLMYFGDSLADVSLHQLGLYTLTLLALGLAYRKFRFTTD